MLILADWMVKHSARWRTENRRRFQIRIWTWFALSANMKSAVGEPNKCAIDGENIMRSLLSITAFVVGLP